MNDWIYAGAVFLGAISLLIEADRNYRSAIGNTPFPYHAIIAKVELEKLCTPREWMLGFFFYSLLYLLAYAIILSSTELYLLVRSANLADLEVGARTDIVGLPSDPLELADTTYGKPIFVSAFLIAFLSAGMMKPVEAYVRALAHRLAGVPRGVYRVLERLQIVDYQELSENAPGALSKKFDATMRFSTFSHVDGQIWADIRTQLSIIDCLAPSVTAGFSRLHFPLSHFDAFQEVPTQLADEVREVQSLLENLDPDRKPSEAWIQELHQKAFLASNSAKAVFAVFYVRNNHAIKNIDPQSPIAKVEEQIAKGYQVELNSFAMSLFFGILLSMFAAFLSYHWNWVQKFERDPESASEEIELAWEKLSPERVLALPNGATVSIALPNDTRGTVELPSGTEVNKSVPETGASKSLILPRNIMGEVDLPSQAIKKVSLDAIDAVTVVDLPQEGLTPLTDLPLEANEQAVILPKETRLRASLQKDLQIVVQVPEDAVARAELDDAPVSARLKPETEATIELSEGQEVVLELLESTKAQVGAHGNGAHETSGNLTMPTLSNCRANLDKINMEELGETNGGNTDLDDCTQAVLNGKEAWLNNQYERFVKWSFWDVLQRGLMVFSTIVTTIFLREVRVDQNSWKPWSFRRIPFLRLLSMSFAPAVIGIFALSSAFVIQLAWEADFNVTQRQVTTLFQGNWAYFVWHLMPCITLSITSLILMDKHDNWIAEASLLLAVVSAGILVGMFWLIATINDAPGDYTVAIPWLLGEPTVSIDILRNTIITATLPAIFVILFAVFLELTEENSRHNWLSARLILAALSPIRRLVSAWSARATVNVVGPVAVAVLTTLLFAGNPVSAASHSTADSDQAVASGTDDGFSDKAEQKILRIGVRSDARPFSYKSKSNLDVLTAASRGPLAQQKYTGFIVKICDAVLTDLLLSPLPTDTKGAMMRLTQSDIEVVDVDELVAKDPEESRFQYFGTEFDILCDPSTITNDRRDGLILSPPLFLSGISFIDLPSLYKPKLDVCPKLPLIGIVGNTTAASSGIKALLNANELPIYKSLLVDWLDDGENKCGKDSEDYKAVKIYASHAAASEAFCNKEFYYYLGDQEIIDHSVRQIPTCEFDRAARTFTIDRYAIYGKIDYANHERALWTARFFEVLSQKVPFSPSILDTAFSDTFVGTEKSRALELFFWSVRGPK